jgi:hypothetical protein
MLLGTWLVAGGLVSLFHVQAALFSRSLAWQQASWF